MSKFERFIHFNKMNYFSIINPYSLQVIDEHSLDTPVDIQTKISNSEMAFQHWKKVSKEQRAIHLMKLAVVLRKNKTEYANLITAEMGKPITEALAEIEKCASTCTFYAEHAADFSKNIQISTEAQKTYVTFQPLGVILGVMPWNFPFWQVFRFAIPTLAVGNSILLKHASNVTGCALAIEQAFVEAEFPIQLFQTLKIKSDQVDAIIRDNRIKGVSLTGSEGAGRAVAATAGASLKKTVLELGGSDPFIVLKDADLNKAVQIGVLSRMQNAGQVCISAKRFIVEESVREAFINGMTKELSDWIPTDPSLASTKMGPMARLDLALEIEKHYHDAIKQGAHAVSVFQRENCLVHPMVLDKVRPGNVAFEVETFGPLAAIISAKDEKEAIALANQTTFGLGATIFSQDIEKAERLGLEIASGMVFVNSIVKSDPRFPIGGINNSGYGREMAGFGMHEFANIKTMCIG